VSARVRLVVLSDVRGNAAALSAVLDALEEMPSQRIVVLGDLSSRGPKGVRVLPKLDERGLLDDRVTTVANTPDALRQELEGHKIIFSQGEEPLDRPEAKLIVFGDEQAPFVRHDQGRALVNAGSAGYPVAGDPRASFAIIDLSREKAPHAEIVRVPYVLEDTVRRIEKRLTKKKVDPKTAVSHLRGLLGDPRLVKDDPPLSPDLRGTELLVRLLATRIHRVYATASGEWPNDDVEHVHHLRVSTRRLREALSIAAPLLPKKVVKKANLRARDLGRTLGQRRIFDVFLEEVKKIAEAEKLELASFLTFLEARRDQATIDYCLAYSKRRLVRHGLLLLGATMWPKDQTTTLAHIARDQLKVRADEVSALMVHLDDKEAHDEHHELRIALKHLRYSAEILASAWPEVIDTETLVPPIKTVQDALGELNDARELVDLADEHGGDGDLVRFKEHIEATKADRYTRAVQETKAIVPGLVENIARLAQTL
jgi:CHAD domain-containing protein/predicted phosphodiesterase